MFRKAVSGILFALLLIGVLAFALNIRLVNASGTIYIKADGSVEPPDAPILNVENVSYTLIDNIYDSIVVERDNIVIDGEGSTVRGTEAYDSKGIYLSGRRNVTIKNMEIKAFYYGILLYGSSNNSIVGNNIANNKYGMGLSESSNNSIVRNNITANSWDGIWLSVSSKNSIVRNNITNNYWGVALYLSSNSKIYYNNFINNKDPVYDGSWDYPEYYAPSINVWDHSYPFGGNYWSNYTGVDLYSGVYQNVTGSDGIGDTALTIDKNNRDCYPLMAPISVFDDGTWNGASYSVDVISNSTVSEFQLNTTEKTIKFNVTGETGLGFCRVTIPNIVIQNMWHGNYTVLINDQPWPFTNWTDTENTHIYFTYQHSEHEITIIPEFPQATILSLFMILSLPVLVFTKRKLSRKHKT